MDIAIDRIGDAVKSPSYDLVEASAWVDNCLRPRSRNWAANATHVLLSLATLSPGQGWDSVGDRRSLAERVKRVVNGRKEIVAVAIGEFATFEFLRVTPAGLAKQGMRSKLLIPWESLELHSRTRPGSAPPGDGDTRVIGVSIDGARQKMYAQPVDLALIFVFAGRSFLVDEWAKAEDAT